MNAFQYDAHQIKEQARLIRRHAVNVSEAALNIYSAVTIYFYLDADRRRGQVSELRKNK